MRYAIVDDATRLVVNVIVADGLGNCPTEPRQTAHACDDPRVEIGWTLDETGVFSPPNEG